jgi:hypothetical protein
VTLSRARPFIFVKILLICEQDHSVRCVSN